MTRWKTILYATVKSPLRYGVLPAIILYIGYVGIFIREARMFQVVYFSRSGNTRKVADAIAGELGVTATDVMTAGVLPPDDFVFLGTGCYGAKLGGGLARFMERNRFNGRKIALFTTSAFGSLAELAALKKQITQKGADIVDSFSCFGQLLLVKKGHPTLKELGVARKFARKVAGNLVPRKSEREKTAGPVR